MKFIKWLLISVVSLVVLIGVGITALVYLVDWNDFKDTIQNQVKSHTGRDLVIAGDLSPSVFPWAGISVGGITLANADGFSDKPFAQVGSADVKVEVLPLLKRAINVRTVELKGLTVNLEQSAEGTTNWADLVSGESSTTTTEEDTTTEVEGNSATIAALAVGGIEIADANVSWNDAMTGTDAMLQNFNLTTGAIALAEPFDLAIDFNVLSDSLELKADVSGKGEVTLDLASQQYMLNGFSLTTKAAGPSLPNGAMDVSLGANIRAMMEEQNVIIDGLSLAALGLQLNGDIDVSQLDTDPQIVGKLASNEFSLLEMFEKLGIEAPVTADPDVLKKASLSLALTASPSAAALDDLTIVLDDTTFSGNASVPSLDGEIPPVRFDFNVDAIDLDRYLPPTVDGEEAVEETADTETAAVDGDAPIELPMDLLRGLDVDGTFSVGSVKVSNLTTNDIVVPVKAAGGKVGVEGLKASLYEGKIASTANIDASGDTPGYAFTFSLDGIQAEPLLGDLLQDDSFLSGKGGFNADITTAGNSVNALKAGLNGDFDTAFNDGSVNGINLGYQLRRVQAALKGKEAPPEESVKTDFSSMTVSGRFDNGVMTSDDLDMRSPLLRLGGAGTVDLPGENIDYTLTSLVTGTSQGQGGGDLDTLKGVKLDIPIRGTFEELAADPTGVIFRGLKDNISSNLKGLADARAKEAAAELKAKANALKAEKEAEARALAAEKQKEVEAKLKAEADKAKDKAKDKLKDGLKGLLK